MTEIMIIGIWRSCDCLCPWVFNNYFDFVCCKGHGTPVSLRFRDCILKKCPLDFIVINSEGVSFVIEMRLFEFYCVDCRFVGDCDVENFEHCVYIVECEAFDVNFADIFNVFAIVGR